MNNDIEIRFHAPPNRVQVVIEVDVETTMCPAPSGIMIGSDEQIARRAVEAALFETVDYNGERDEQGPFRPCLSGRGKIRMGKGAGL